MRIILAAVFAIVGVPLVVSALGTLVMSPPVDQRTFAMMQVIAGLLCILIAVVAGLTRPAAHAAVPREAAPPPAAEPLAPRDRAGMGVLVVVLALVLIALAQWLRTSDRDRDARAAIPGPASGSARPMTRAVTPAGGGDSRRSTVKAHAPSRARPVRADH